MSAFLTTLGNKIDIEADKNSPTDQLWLTFRQGLEQAIQKFVPSRTLKSKSGLPWISKKIKSMIRKKEKLYRKMRQSKSQIDTDKFRQMRHKCQSEIRKAYNTFLDGIISPDPKQPPKRFWSYIKSLRKDNVGVAPLKVQGRVASTAASKAEILNSQFTSGNLLATYPTSTDRTTHLCPTSTFRLTAF
jgi:hypothetical protein